MRVQDYFSCLVFGLFILASLPVLADPIPCPQCDAPNEIAADGMAHCVGCNLFYDENGLVSDGGDEGGEESCDDEDMYDEDALNTPRATTPDPQLLNMPTYSSSQGIVCQQMVTEHEAMVASDGCNSAPVTGELVITKGSPLVREPNTDDTVMQNYMDSLARKVSEMGFKNNQPPSGACAAKVPPPSSPPPSSDISPTAFDAMLDFYHQVITPARTRRFQFRVIQQLARQNANAAVQDSHGTSLFDLMDDEVSNLVVIGEILQSLVAELQNGAFLFVVDIQNQQERGFGQIQSVIYFDLGRQEFVQYFYFEHSVCGCHYISVSDLPNSLVVAMQTARGKNAVMYHYLRRPQTPQ